MSDLYHSVPSNAEWLPYPKSRTYVSETELRSWGDWRDIENNVAAIKRYLPSGCCIEFHCYNKQEAEETRARLTEEEKRLVRFFWLTFLDPQAGGERRAE